MGKLFEQHYPNSPEGWARKRLAAVAQEIADHCELPPSPQTRISLIVQMHKINRDDLPENLQRLYYEFAVHLAME